MKYGRETIAVALRILTELGRRRRSLIFWSIFPILVLTLNGLILAERAQLSLAEAFAHATPPTLMGAALFFSCLGGSVATVVAEREHRTLKRLFLSPLSGVSYFLGIVAAHCAIGLAQAVLVYAIATALGANFRGAPLASLSVILLSIAAYVGVGFVLGAQFARRTEDINALIAAFGVPLLILGGAFLPTSLFPDSLQSIADYNPIYHMIAALSGISVSGDSLTEIHSHLWFLGMFAALMVIAGGWAYGRMLRLERRL